LADFSTELAALGYLQNHPITVEELRTAYKAIADKSAHR
jgi:hypothetical protein